MSEIQTRLRQNGGVLVRRQHRDLSGSIDRAVRTGSLVRLFPGIYGPPGSASDPWLRLRAAAAWAGPDAVFCGWAAARLTFWEACPIETVTLALPDQGRRSRAGVDVTSRRIPPDLVMRRGRFQVTVPALTAVDLAGDESGGEAIDRALMGGSVTLPQLWEVLARLPCRPGNRTRALLLSDSRDEPWSEAERLQHRILRQAGISGFRTNVWVRAGEGDGYYVDVLFDEVMLVLEVDGWETHGTRRAFEEDRRRRNALVLAGYRVLNVTWRQLTEDPAWVLRCVRDGLGR